MPQPFNVSRRNLVTLAASAAAAGAVPAAARSATASASSALASPAQVLAASRERVLHELARVRRAPGAASRAQAFAALAAAVQLHRIAGSHAAAHHRGNAGSLTGLYRGSEPAAMLAEVIVRELEARPAGGPAWMVRFAELEAVIRDQAA